jgi:hypothetical protein
MNRLTLFIAGIDTYTPGQILPTLTAGRHIALNCLTLFIAGMDTYKLGQILPTRTAGSHIAMNCLTLFIAGMDTNSVIFYQHTHRNSDDSRTLARTY